MDVWDPYGASERGHLPLSESKIVFDQFHIAQYLARAVDKVRREENKWLKQAGDERLVGRKYLWRCHPGSFNKKQWRAFEELRESDLKTARALKETAMCLFDFRRLGVARKFFRRRCYWVPHSRLEPMQAAARMMNEWLENILTYLKHGITNAVSEALKAKIQWVKYTARGFRNQQNFITAIHFHCGGLELAP